MTLMPKRKIERRQWRRIEGYEGVYNISSDGMVMSHAKKYPKPLKPTITLHGYLTVTLYINGNNKIYKIHRLVAQAFIPNPNNKPQINHIDGLKNNNHYKNLEWATSSENLKHAFASGLRSHKGENHPMCKLTKADVLLIRSREHTNQQLSTMLGVSPKYITEVRIKRRWKHI